MFSAPARADEFEDSLRRYQGMYQAGQITRDEYDTLVRQLNQRLRPGSKGCLWPLALVGGTALLYGGYRAYDAIARSVANARKDQVLDQPPPADDFDKAGLLQFLSAPFPQGMGLTDGSAKVRIDNLRRRHSAEEVRRRAELVKRAHRAIWSKEPADDHPGYETVDRITDWNGRDSDDQVIAKLREEADARQRSREAQARLPGLLAELGLPPDKVTELTTLIARRRTSMIALADYETALRTEFLNKNPLPSAHEIEMYARVLTEPQRTPSDTRLQVDFNLEGERTGASWVTFATTAWPQGLGLSDADARELLQRHIIGSSNRKNLEAWARRRFIELATPNSQAPNKQQLSAFFDAVFAKQQKDFDALFPPPAQR